MKSGKTRIVKSMKKVIGEGKANFNFKTMGVLKSYICCLRIVRNREKLRKTPELRQVLYFNKGLERLDKEADLAYIVQNVRIMRYFLKSVLDKD